MEDLQAYQHILSLYEGASSQQIDRKKTTLFFSKAVPEEKKGEILSFLGVPEIKEYEKYLGLPAVVGKNKKASLNYIKERVWAKIQGWKEKLLSQVGRDFAQGGGTSYPYICNKLLQVASGFVQGY